jgi:hypothetical protein
MSRRTVLSLLGLGVLSVIAVSTTAPFHAAFAKDGSGGGGEGGDKSDDKTDGAEGKPEERQQSGDQNGSETEQPGMEAQPEAATECTAGTACKKE